MPKLLDQSPIISKICRLLGKAGDYWVRLEITGQNGTNLESVQDLVNPSLPGAARGWMSGVAAGRNGEASSHLQICVRSIHHLSPAQPLFMIEYLKYSFIHH